MMLKKIRNQNRKITTAEHDTMFLISASLNVSHYTIDKLFVKRSFYLILRSTDL